MLVSSGTGVCPTGGAGAGEVYKVLITGSKIFTEGLVCPRRRLYFLQSDSPSESWSPNTSRSCVAAGSPEYTAMLLQWSVLWRHGLQVYSGYAQGCLLRVASQPLNSSCVLTHFVLSLRRSNCTACLDSKTL